MQKASAARCQYNGWNVNHEPPWKAGLGCVRRMPRCWHGLKEKPTHRGVKGGNSYDYGSSSWAVSRVPRTAQIPSNVLLKSCQTNIVIKSKHNKLIRRLHQGLIPSRTWALILPSFIPLSKAQWLEEDLKSTIAPRHPTPFPPGPSWIPKASGPVYQHQGIRQSSQPPHVKRGAQCVRRPSVISPAVDRSSEGSAVITGSLRWRQQKGTTKKERHRS